VTDLAGTQITSLLETLPGIARVLRSPVADAFINLIKAGTGQAEFALADADEVLKYAVRRNLMAVEESERILAEASQAVAARGAASRARAASRQASAKAKTPHVRKRAAPKAVAKKARKPVRVHKPVKAKKPAKAPARRAAKPKARKK
jgi:hypothetical protein